MKKGTHQFTVRVPYGDVDAMGIVYYANYFVYFEMARAEFLRDIGLPYTQLEQRGVMLPVVEAHCQYKSPARFEDLLIVCSRVSLEKNIKFRFEYELYRDETLLVTGYTCHVCMKPGGKVARLDPELLEKSKPYTDT